MPSIGEKKFLQRRALSGKFPDSDERPESPADVYLRSRLKEGCKYHRGDRSGQESREKAQAASKAKATEFRWGRQSISMKKVMSSTHGKRKHKRD